MIEITTTAVGRAEILRKTYSSFKENLFKDHPVRLIINIDPVGPDDPKKVLAVAEEFFPIHKVRMPEEAWFPSAFKWAWEQTSTEYVFNLEDDWVLLREIDLEDMLRVMKDNPKLAHLRLHWRPIANRAKCWKFFFDWNGSYFECPSKAIREVGFCGHPSLLRGEFVRDTAALLQIESNPEKQYHYNRSVVNEVDKWDYGVYGQQNTRQTILDIGRAWINQSNWRKQGTRAFFRKWEERDGDS